MSTKSTIAHDDSFHLYDEVIAGGTYLELDTHDFSVSYEDFQKQPRLPKALLDRLQLDGKQLKEDPGWSGEAGEL